MDMTPSFEFVSDNNILSQLSIIVQKCMEADFKHQDTTFLIKSMKELVQRLPNLSGLIKTEREALIMYFLSKYCDKALPQQTLANYKKYLLNLEDRFPVLGKTKRKISKIQEEILDFFVSTGSTYMNQMKSTLVELPSNPVSKIIVQTEIGCIEARYKTYEPIRRLTPNNKVASKIDGNLLCITMNK